MEKLSWAQAVEIILELGFEPEIKRTISEDLRSDLNPIIVQELFANEEEFKTFPFRPAPDSDHIGGRIILYRTDPEDIAEGFLLGPI